MVKLSEYEPQKVFRFDNTNDPWGGRAFSSDVVIAHQDGKPWLPFLENRRKHQGSGREFQTVLIVPIGGNGPPFPTTVVKENGSDEWIITNLFHKEII